MRQTVKKILKYQLRTHSQVIDDALLSQPAIVFAPHPDDETLGCGGTLIKMGRLGATVKIVFMTNGNQSHAHLISPNELSAMRHTEAVKAAEVLGVSAANVKLLDFPDGQLRLHRERASESVLSMLRQYKPAIVFVPASLEPPQDHRATFWAVTKAISQWGQPVIKIEYPIWLWFHFPWVKMPHSRREWKTWIQNSIITLAGLRFITDFRHKVVIEEVTSQKLSALQQHRSQMETLRDNWPVLSDVSDGEWLDCFFQEVEVFKVS